MNSTQNNPEIDGNQENAVSIYGADNALDDFPVLKAFQHYIDSEQAKARKRLVSLGIFFGVLMGAVIAVFVAMLVSISQRNQDLNDRLVEYAMKERDRQAPVVVQPPAQQDSAAIISLTGKIEEMNKKLAESQKRAEEAERAQKAAVAAAEEAAKPKTPSAQDLEIKRLKTLLASEKEKMAEEKERQHKAEIEAWNRQRYPECYAQPKIVQPAPVVITQVIEKVTIPAPVAKPKADEKVIEESTKQILRGKRAIKYFDEDEDEDEEAPSQPAPKKQVKAPSPAPKPAPAPEPVSYDIPVKVEGKTSTWRLP